MGIASTRDKPLGVVLSFAKNMDLAAYSALVARNGHFRLLAGEQRLELAGQACLCLNADAAILDAAYPNQAAFVKAWELRSGGYDGAMVFLDAEYAIFRAARARDISRSAYFTRDDEIEPIYQWMRNFEESNGAASAHHSNGCLPRSDLSAPSSDESVLLLTPRERQVMRYLALGLNNQQVAAQLHLSESTIDNHKVRLMRKLEVHNRSALIHLAIRTGLIDPPAGRQPELRCNGAAVS